MFGFSAILMCSWESLLSSLSIVLTNGGTAGLIWTWAIVWLGFTAVYLSMAEVRLLTRHAMIPLSLHTLLLYADADVDADIAGITQMGSMAPTTGGKALTLKKEKVTGEEKKKERTILMLYVFSRPISLGE